MMKCTQHSFIGISDKKFSMIFLWAGALFTEWGKQNFTAKSATKS